MDEQNKKKETKRSKFRIFFFVVLFLSIVAFYVDGYTTTILNRKSIKLTIWLQRTHIDSYVSLYLSTYIYIMFMTVFLIYILSRDYTASFTLINSFSINNYASIMLRFYYVDPRPVFMNQVIRERLDYCDYGKPNHSLFVTIPIFLWLNEMIDSRLSQTWLRYSLKVTFFLLLMVQCYCNLYLGIASISQLILSIIFGTLSFTVQAKMEDLVQAYILQPIMNKDNLKKKNSIIIIMTLFALSNYLMIALWSSKYTQFEHLDNLVFKFRGCIECLADFKANFSSKMVREGLGFNLVFGMYLGIYLMPIKVYNFSDYLMDRRPKQVILRIIFYVIFLLPLFFLNYPAVEEPYLAFFRTIFSALLAGYLITNAMFRIMQNLSKVENEFFEENSVAAIEIEEESKLMALGKVNEDRRDFYA